ncbi:hypothetical protein [Novosphingobium sp. ZW T3_23]|uniref:hypothetical protein n=1 Tax=Novosphingobium sp. ZW T3_23 TaxID=3378084 RepID=UPI003854215B
MAIPVPKPNALLADKVYDVDAVRENVLPQSCRSPQMTTTLCQRELGFRRQGADRQESSPNDLPKVDAIDQLRICVPGMITHGLSAWMMAI